MLYRSINQLANLQGKVIEPVHSIAYEQSIKLFFKVRTSQQECLHNLSKLSYSFSCQKCPNSILYPASAEVNHFG